MGKRSEELCQIEWKCSNSLALSREWERGVRIVSKLGENVATLWLCQENVKEERGLLRFLALSRERGEGREKCTTVKIT